MVGREATPSAACIDSQSVKTTSVGGVRGYDAGKKVKGRKRHLLVDSQGLVIRALVTEASISDKQGAMQLLEPLPGKLPRMQKMWADGGYGGVFPAWVKQTPGWEVEITKHPSRRPRVWVSADYEIDWAKILAPKGFHVLPHRGVAERTFAWLYHQRRLSKDYEYLTQTSESWIYLMMSRLMVRRLARSNILNLSDGFL